ncbi:T6SS effector BTH_I2691 family protein [Niveibacterium sp.]|uniref:T6SS effector BTH_I2691 family protein n=1 Tax=Niveibacterium sp. TaxID=2017444 RepID=UPI0035AF6991
MSIDNCKYCNRIGLPLLPLRIAYVPGESANKPATLPSAPHMPTAPVRDGKYVLRVISEGYVYLFDERAGGVWRCFAATTSGHFQEILLDAPPNSPPTFHCGEKGHNVVASLINVTRASEAGKVWVGYSRTWWTAKVRKQLKSDAQLRGKLMVGLNAAEAVSGGSIPADAGVRVATGNELAKLVGEYAATPAAFSAVDHRYASYTTAPAIDRSGQADALITRMHANSPGNAIVLCLPDTVGVAQDINHWRNLQAGELAKYQGDAAKLRSRIVGDIILDLESSMRKQGQGKVWDERYAPKVSMQKVHADKAAHDKKVKELEAHILRASDDWYAWANSDFFKLAWQVYDGADAQHGKSIGAAMERDFARCVFGSGATPKEQTWWQAWLTADPADAQHPLWLAFTAADKDVIAFLKGDAAKPLDVGKLDKGVDLVKQSKDLTEKLREWHEVRKAKGLQRSAQAESGLLAVTFASQLSVLARSKPEAALVAGQRLRLVIVSRMEVLVTPNVQKVTLQQMVVQMHEAVWGPPKSQMSKVVQEARSLKIAQGVDGAWLGSRFTATRVVATEVWMPETAVGLGQAKVPKTLPAPAAQIALPRPALNPWQGLTQYIRNSKALGQGLLGLGTALQISNLSANLIQLDRALKGNASNRDDNITECLYGVVSGSLGLMALTGEVFAGAMAARVTPAVVTTSAARLLAIAGWTALGGGLLGCASAGLDAYQAFGKSSGLELDGDKDAASSYRRAARASVVAAIGSGALTVIATGALLAQAGATGVAASAVVGAASFVGMGAAIPVAGWIVLVIGATVAGIYFAYKAATAEDTPLEKWLSRCEWRNEEAYKGTSRTKYRNLKDEMAEFQLALYGINVVLNWNDRFGKDEVEVSVVMPGFRSAVSSYALSLQLFGPGRRQTVVTRQTSAFSEDPDLKPQPPTQAYFSAVPPGQKLIPMDEVLQFSEPFTLALENGVATYAGKLRVNEDFYDRVRLKLEYWPDPANHPDLHMIPVPGGANYAETRD